MQGRVWLVAALVISLGAMFAAGQFLGDQGVQPERAVAVTSSPTPALTATPTAMPGTADIEALSFNASPPHVGTGSGSTTLTEWVRNKGPMASTVADTTWNCYKDLHIHPVNCRFQAHPGDACFQNSGPVACDTPGNIDELRFAVTLPLNESTAVMRQLTISCGVAPGFGGENFTATVTSFKQSAAGSPPDPNPNNNTISTGLSVFCPNASPTATATTTSTPGPTTPASPTPTPTPTPTPDSDGDGWLDGSEVNFIGTDPLDACPDNTLDDAWPPDVTNNMFVDTGDIGAVTNWFGAAVPTAPARVNIGPDPPDGFVDTADIARMTDLFGQGCT